MAVSPLPLLLSLLLLLLPPIAAKNYPLEIHPNATFAERRAAMFEREQRVLYDDPLYPHPDRLAGRKLQGGGPGGGGGGGLATPALLSDYGASMLGSVGKTTVAGTDPYSSITFPVGTIIAGPFEAGFDAAIDTLLSWLGCSPASKGYLVGGIDTATSLLAVNYQCGALLPAINTTPPAIYKSLMWSMGVHSPPDGNGCTSPPAGIAGYCTAINPSFHFHQYFLQLYSTTAAGHSTKIGVTTPTSGSVAASNIYGMYEATGVLPTLDACNAHWGTTPDSPSTQIYHHHVTDAAPFAVGCYGPPGGVSGALTSTATCRTYYAGCDGTTVTFTTSAGTQTYDNWCPCYDKTTGSNLAQYAGGGSNSTTPSSTPAATSLSTGAIVGIAVGAAAALAIIAAVATYLCCAAAAAALCCCGCGCCARGSDGDVGTPVGGEFEIKNPRQASV